EDGQGEGRCRNRRIARKEKRIFSGDVFLKIGIPVVVDVGPRVVASVAEEGFFPLIAEEVAVGILAGAGWEQNDLRVRASTDINHFDSGSRAGGKWRVGEDSCLKLRSRQNAEIAGKPERLAIAIEQ